MSAHTTHFAIMPCHPACCCVTEVFQNFKWFLGAWQPWCSGVGRRILWSKSRACVLIYKDRRICP